MRCEEHGIVVEDVVHRDGTATMTKGEEGRGLVVVGAKIVCVSNSHVVGRRPMAGRGLILDRDDWLVLAAPSLTEPRVSTNEAESIRRVGTECVEMRLRCGEGRGQNAVWLFFVISFLDEGTK